MPTTKRTINDRAPHDGTAPPERLPPGIQTSAGRTRRSGPHAARGKQTCARIPRACPGTRVRPTVLRAWDWGVLRSARTATASERGQSSSQQHRASLYSARRGHVKERTKRHSPASANGLVVNHSHMNALVEPSFTESINPRMSSLTAGHHVREPDGGDCTGTAASTYP
jgi:hypothetical protein